MAEIIFDDMTTGWSDALRRWHLLEKEPFALQELHSEQPVLLTAIRLYKATQNPGVSRLVQEERGLVYANRHDQYGHLPNRGRYERRLKSPNRNAQLRITKGVAIAVLAGCIQTNDKSYLELAEKIARYHYHAIGNRRGYTS